MGCGRGVMEVRILKRLARKRAKVGRCTSGNVGGNQEEKSNAETRSTQRLRRDGHCGAGRAEKDGRTEGGDVRETARTGRDLRPVEEKRMEECGMGVRGGGEDRHSRRSPNLPWGE